MNLVNIANRGRLIYLFLRNEEGKLKIREVDDFYPYFYEPHSSGKAKGWDDKSLKKVICQSPKDIPQMRSPEAYEADVRYPIRYLVDKVDKINRCPVKVAFVDIEVLATGKMPQAENAIYPISCITVYNSFTKKYFTFYLNDYHGSLENKEQSLIEDFIQHMQAKKYDLFCAWNVQFDYNYLHNRTREFAKRLSPIGVYRGSAGKGENIFYPAGLSIVDYMGLYQKFTLNKRRQYSLDYIAQVDLGEEEWGETLFGQLTPEIKEKNKNDVRRLVDLDEKFRVIDYFNEVRCFIKNVMWEDLAQETIRREGRLIVQSNNSRIIDGLILQEAHDRGVVLPSKVNDNEDSGYQGAFREATEIGLFWNLAKCDLTSAYPRLISDFCLDSQNISAKKNGIKIEIKDRVTKTVGNTYYVKQDNNALLPTVVNNLLVIKDKLKKELKGFKPDTDDYKKAETKYNAIKSVINSCYGVFGNRFFRLYDKRIAETTAFLVRDLLSYVQKALQKDGSKVIYIDTDSVFIQGKENIADKLNQYIQDWAIEEFNNKKVKVEFDYEGYFEKILIKKLCHYYGYVRSPKGLKKEIKGMELKKSSSARFESKFQETLIEKLLNKESRANISNWIESEKDRIRRIPLTEIAIPFKIQSTNYKNIPIFLRAFRNTQKFNPSFNAESGELLYYLPVDSYGLDAEGKDIDVMAFTNKTEKYINKERIRWDEVIRRNIDLKVDGLLEAINWKSAKSPFIVESVF